MSGFLHLWQLSVLLLITFPRINCQIKENVQIKIDDTYCTGNVCRDLVFPSAQTVISFESNETSLQSVLRFESTVFTNFPLNLFLAFPKVSELDMRNCSISHMTWENFLWAVDLKVLLLSNNFLTKIDELTFSYAMNLQFLWLEGNRIRTLVSESFKGLVQLKYLSLMDNRISSIPDGLFDDLRNLEVVILSGNRIKEIQNNLFTKSPKLLSVDLKNNHIRNITDDAFKGLGNLMHLDISRNKPLRTLIANIDVVNLYAEMCSLRAINIYGRVNFAKMSGNRINELYFSKPESLGMLDLKNNSLQQIASLTRATNLNYLDLSDNPNLGTVPDPWGVSSLQRLDLSNTGLKEFPESILGNKGQELKLKYLNISDNLITHIDPRLFSRLENITNFYFHANDWSCYHLRLMIGLLVRAKGIAFSTDLYDPNFPGEYIDGVKCLYRSVDDDTNESTISEQKTPSQIDAAQDVQNLRNELKTIVRFYEQKFQKVMTAIENIQTRLDTLTAENATMWQHITVIT